MKNLKAVAGFVGGVCAAAAVFAGVVSAPAVSETPASATWNFANDFAFPVANPTADSYGNAGVWAYMQGTPQSSAGYTLLPNSATGCDNGAVDSWTTSGEPWIARNRGADTNCGTPFLPAGSGAMNPSGSQAAILRWTSPVSGKVAVTGSAVDADGGGGDGIAWSIDKGDTVIASGAFANGGSQTFASGTGGAGLDAIEITAGDMLYLSVSANGTYYWDTTRVNFTITWTESPTTASTSTSTTSTSTTSTSTTSTSTTTTSTTLATTTSTTTAGPCSRPTIVVPASKNARVVYGTDGNDIILGSAGPDSIDGRGGNDVICGGGGNDKIVGGNGDDTLYGGADADQLRGDAGTDRLYGEAGRDSIAAGNGDDRAYGGEDDDTISGDAGQDTLNGGAGRDAISGSTGKDSLFGDAGDDRLDGGGQPDNCDGGDGRDSVTSCEIYYQIP